jgi:ankyrin repeat protein
LEFIMRTSLKWLLQLVLSIGVSSVHAGAYEDFFKAIEMDDSRTISSLIRRGFDANSPSVSGQTPLFLALRSGSHQAVAALLTAADLKVDQPNEANETALMMAALRGHLDWCKRLVERGAAVNREGWTPLHYAATGPNPLVTAYLLEMRAAVDAPSPNATTPLMMAARYGHEDSVRLLLAANANPRLRNQKDLSAADFARDAGREALAQQLAQLAR